MERGAALALGHRLGPHGRVEPGWLQAGDLRGGLSLTPSLACLGRVLQHLPQPLLRALDLSAGVLGDALPGTQGFPWMPQGSVPTSASLPLAPCPLPTPNWVLSLPLGSAVTAALRSSPQKVSCLHPGLQQRVSPERGERGVRPRPTQRRFHQIMRGGPAPSDPLPGTPGRDCQGRGAAGKSLSPRLTPVFGVLGRSRTLPPPDISQMGIAR